MFQKSGGNLRILGIEKLFWGFCKFPPYGQGEIMWGFWQQLCRIWILRLQRKGRIGEEGFSLGDGGEEGCRLRKKMVILPSITLRAHVIPSKNVTL